MFRVQDDRSLSVHSASRACPLAFTNPQDGHHIPFHLTNDLHCFWYFEHGADIPSSKLDLSLGPEEIIFHTSDFLLEAFITGSHASSSLAQVHYRIHSISICHCLPNFMLCFTGWGHWPHAQPPTCWFCLAFTPMTCPACLDLPCAKISCSYNSRWSLRHTSLPTVTRYLHIKEINLIYIFLTTQIVRDLLRNKYYITGELLDWDIIIKRNQSRRSQAKMKKVGLQRYLVSQYTMVGNLTVIIP